MENIFSKIKPLFEEESFDAATGEQNAEVVYVPDFNTFIQDPQKWLSQLPNYGNGGTQEPESANDEINAVESGDGEQSFDDNGIQNEGDNSFGGAQGSDSGSVSDDSFGGDNAGFDDTTQTQTDTTQTQGQGDTTQTQTDTTQTQGQGDTTQTQTQTQTDTTQTDTDTDNSSDDAELGI